MKNSANHSSNLVESQDKNLEGLPVRYYHFSLIDSTNTWAKQNLDAWLRDGLTIVSAAEQAGGRGRFKRRWVSPPDVNIYVSYCLFVGTDISIGQIPQALAVSAAQVLEEYHLSPTLKWPNDLLVDEKKIGGILCEAVDGGSTTGVVCGIGLNVNMEAKIADTIDQPATSLFIAKGKQYAVEGVLEKLNAAFCRNLQLFLEKGFADFAPYLIEKSRYKLGDVICLEDGYNVWIGQFQRICEDGAMEMLLPDGSLKRCSSGEII